MLRLAPGSRPGEGRTPEGCGTWSRAGGRCPGASTRAGSAGGSVSSPGTPARPPAGRWKSQAGRAGASIASGAPAASRRCRGGSRRWGSGRWASCFHLAGKQYSCKARRSPLGAFGKQTNSFSTVLGRWGRGPSPPPASSSAHRVCARRGCSPTRAPVTCSSHLRANSAGRVGGGGRGRSGVWARLLPAPVLNSTAEAHLHEARERPHPNLPWCGDPEARLQNAAPRPPRHPEGCWDPRQRPLLFPAGSPPAPPTPGRGCPRGSDSVTHLGNGHRGPPVWAPWGPREPPGDERSDIPVGSQVVSLKEQRLGPHGA